MHVRRLITFRVLCAMASAELHLDPSMSDGEWKARVKDRLVKQGWDYPRDREMLTRALNASNFAYQKRHGPRPIPEIKEPQQQKPHRPEPLNADPPWHGHHRSESALTLKQLIENLQRSSKPDAR